MKHKFSLIWRVAVAMVLVLSFSLVAAVPAAADVETFYVDPILGNDSPTQGTGPGYDAFETIQYAISDSSVTDGDTIELAEGTYDLAATIDLSKAITLTSESGAAYTILKPTASLCTGRSDHTAYPAIKVTADGSATYPVIIDGLTFTRKEHGSEFDCAIYNDGFDHMTVQNCTFNYVIPDDNSAHEAVIFVRTGSGAITSCTISDNIFTNCCDLDTDASRAATIEGRTDSGGGTLTGLTISGNELTNCDDYGIELRGDLEPTPYKISADITNNTFTNGFSCLNVGMTKGASPYGRVTITGNTFTGASNYAINVEDGNNQVEIKCNTITGTIGDKAVKLAKSEPDSTTHVVQYNNIYDNKKYGVSAGTKGTPAYDCQHNWWGTTVVSKIQAMLLYNNLAVTGTTDVDYDPPLTAPYSAAAITSPKITYPIGVKASPGDVVTVEATVTEGASAILSAATEIFDGMTEADSTFTVAMTVVATTGGLCTASKALTVADGVEDGSYPLTITATGICDEEDIDESLSLEVGTTTSWDIDLYEGWNLISLSLIPDDSDITVVISADTLDDVTNVTSVYYFYNDGTDTGWQSYVPGSGGTLTDMEDGKAYFIYMTGADTLTVAGQQMPTPPVVPPTYDVYAGWNFIGFKSVENMAHGTYLNSLITASEEDYSILWGYDNTTGYFRVFPSPQTHGTADSGDMEVGYGYWLYLTTSSGTITP